MFGIAQGREDVCSHALQDLPVIGDGGAEEIFAHPPPKKVITSLEDKQLLKESKAGGFLVKFMYRL